VTSVLKGPVGNTCRAFVVLRAYIMQNLLAAKHLSVSSWPFIGTSRTHIKGMRLVAKHILTAFLMSVLVSTAPVLALARSAPGAAGVTTICTGTGTFSVVVDGEGQPMGAAHVCPDCALSALGAVIPGALGLPRFAAASRDAMASAEVLPAAWCSRPQACARSPPADRHAVT
jgi:hypothetical protein